MNSIRRVYDVPVCMLMKVGNMAQPPTLTDSKAQVRSYTY